MSPIFYNHKYIVLFVNSIYEVRDIASSVFFASRMCIGFSVYLNNEDKVRNMFQRKKNESC